MAFKENPPKILFIPVSSTSGSGEYYRSLMLADEVNQRFPRAEIHFILNKNASYASKCKYRVHLSDFSATKDTPIVERVIKEIMPNLVIFDCSGRGCQFKFAKNMGAKIIFISQHKRKRAKGLKLNRIGYIDRHWVVQPNFAIAPLSWVEKTKLKIFNKHTPKNIGPILANYETDSLVLEKLKLTKLDYMVFSPGAGSHKKNEKLSADLFYSAAKKITEQFGIKCVMVFGVNYPNKLPSDNSVICLGELPPNEFSQLIFHAKGLVISGGDTLLQAIEMKKPSIAIALTKDQPARIKACEKKSLVLSALLEEEDIINKVDRLFNRDTLENLYQSLNSQSLLCGREAAVQGISQLLE